MARWRQWYEDVVDVALRATLKEHGFKRKSPSTYVFDRSPDRVWAFELGLCHSQAEYFSECSGIFAPKIAESVNRFGIDKWVWLTGMRTATHTAVGIAELVKIENGWDAKSWSRNPRSSTWYGGYRRPPSFATILRHIQPGGCYSYDAAGNVSKVGENEWRRRIATITEELGHDLDDNWRKYELRWLQNCDEPAYFARWLEERVHGRTELLLAIAYHLAGDADRAASFLNKAIHDGERPFEAVAAELREQAIERGDKSKLATVDEDARSLFKYLQSRAEATRHLASGLGICL